MDLILQIFITGIGILIVAIILNMLARALNILTWYDFFNKISKKGFKETIKDYWPHLFFLVFLYPFLLGAFAYYILILFALI